MRGALLKAILRAPTVLYRVGAGRLLGRRFLLLVHRGRKTGRTYRTVLEVVQWRPERGEAVVMSGFGERANWYRNVLANGAVGVEIAGERWLPSARRLEVAEAAAVIADYERRNRVARPIVRTVLSRLAGFHYDGSPAARERLVQILPLVALRARAPRRPLA